MPTLVLSAVEVDGRIVDVVVTDGRIESIRPAARTGKSSAGSKARGDGDTGVVELDGRGGALLPGLWDHHIHLLALAAARQSVDLGGTRGHSDLSPLGAAVRHVPPGQWIRAVGFYPGDVGAFDRHALDIIAPNHPVRVQHSGGAMWFLNSAALATLDLSTAPPGLECDADGEPTGRLYDADSWLATQIDHVDPPDLSGIGSELARYGVVGVTDATPYASPEDLAGLAVAADGLPQHVVATGGPALADHAFPPRLQRGPVKLLLSDHELPALDTVADWIDRAHQADRPVMVHCVTRVGLVLALAAWDEAGARLGDRIEHGSVIPPELDRSIQRHGLAVVTQPSFIAERGDRYLAEVDGDDIAHLYPCRRLIERGIPVGGSTDAPFGQLSPWAAIGAATSRTSASGRRVGDDEPLTPGRALALFLTDPSDPGGRARRIEPGQPANLCLLGTPLSRALGDAVAGDDVVAATIIDGVVRWTSSEPGGR